MWSIKHPIALITTKNSWFETPIFHLRNILIEKNFNCYVAFSHEDVMEDSIAFYLSYRKLVSQSFIDKSYESLVIHASDLPKGRGFSPWVWQILEGKNVIPLTLFSMVEAMDAGDIYARDDMILKGDELLEEIRDMLALHIQKMVISYLSSPNKPQSYQQTGEPTFYKRRTALDSEIDLNKTIKEQFNLLRTVDNNEYPAFFRYMGKKYILKIEEDPTFIQKSDTKEETSLSKIPAERI